VLEVKPRVPALRVRISKQIQRLDAWTKTNPLVSSPFNLRLTTIFLICRESHRHPVFAPNICPISRSSRCTQVVASRRRRPPVRRSHSTFLCLRAVYIIETMTSVSSGPVPLDLDAMHRQSIQHGSSPGKSWTPPAMSRLLRHAFCATQGRTRIWKKKEQDVFCFVGSCFTGFVTW
jgi:hypothetical protein